MPELKTFTLEVLYDGVWVEDIKVPAETDYEAHAIAKQQARDNLEVKHKERA